MFFTFFRAICLYLLQKDIKIVLRMVTVLHTVTFFHVSDRFAQQWLFHATVTILHSGYCFSCGSQCLHYCYYTWWWPFFMRQSSAKFVLSVKGRSVHSFTRISCSTFLPFMKEYRIRFFVPWYRFLLGLGLGFVALVKGHIIRFCLTQTRFYFVER